ncbi:MAG: PAS domain S-box protein [Desulfohalobiaceae bacterium]|nr:PAS domain S-box protein [Desulfohalobiaceae bacterium]
MRILLVEDLPTDADLAQREIEKELGPCEFLRVETREDYEQALKNFQPEIIVSDYMMPAFDGMSALLIALDQVPDVPFIILTGSMNEETAVECMKAGAWDYVIKEHVKRLGPAVQSVLKQRDLRLERKKARKKVEHLNKVLMAIRNVNQLIVREKDRQRLIQSTCDILIESRSYFNAWILLCQDTGEITASAQVGLEEEFQSLLNWVKDNGLPECGRQDKAQTEVLVIPDPSTVCPECPLRHYYRGRSAVSAPLRYKGYVYGVLTVSISRELAESKEEQLLLQEVADDLGFALYDLDLQDRNKQAEASLRESERKYRLVVENANEGIFIMQDGQYKYANAYGLRLFACSREELVGSKVLEHVHPEDRDWLSKRIELRYAGEPVQDSVEHRIIDTRGEIKWVETRGALTQWEDRVANIGFAVDITERKKAEAEFEKHRLILAEAEKVAGLGGWEWDVQRDVWSVTENWRQIHGCSKQRLTTAELLPIAHPEDREQVQQALQNAVSKGEPYALEHRIVSQDTGEVKHIRVFGDIRHNAGGRVEKVFGAALDVTAEKQAHANLQASETRYRELFNSIRDAILVADTERNIIDCNKAFCELFGYSPAEIKGRKTHAVYADQDEFERMGQELKKQKDQQQFVYTIHYQKKTGESFPGETNVFYLRNAENTITGFIGVIRDVSQRKQHEAEKEKLEQQLYQAQRLESVGRLAGGVAHDFNNLLTTVTGNSEMALMDLDKADPLHELIEEIKTVGERAARLTRQLLAFSRKQILQPEVLDLNDILQDMHKMFKRTIGEHIELKTVLSPEIGTVKADPGQMEQVIMNLVVNAKDAMPEGGWLTMETSEVTVDEAYARAHGVEIQPGSYVMLAVSDTGTGMTPEVRAQAFEPFFTTKEKGAGTGLGLSMVYGIVKQSSGFIWCYSEPGQGTTFKIYLPLSDEAQPDHEVLADETEELQGWETVLLVEDELSVRRTARKVLDRFGYTVLDAPNAEKAQSVFAERQGEIHLLLTDVVMPGMNGQELAGILREQKPDLKVLYMSGYTDLAVVRNGSLSKQAPFLQKPFTPEGLVRKVREVLETDGRSD